MTLTQPVCGVDGVSVGLFLWIGSGTRAVLESRQKCEGNVLPYVFKTYGMFLWAPQSLLCPSLRKLMHQWGGGLHESSEEYSPPAWCSNTEPVHVCGRWCMQNVIENLLRPHPPPSYCCAPSSACFNITHLNSPAPYPMPMTLRFHLPEQGRWVGLRGCMADRAQTPSTDQCQRQCGACTAELQRAELRGCWAARVQTAEIAKPFSTDTDSKSCVVWRDGCRA